MSPKFPRLGVAIVMLTLAGCQKKVEAPVVQAPEPPKPQAIEVVKTNERSRHFLAVSRQLELGGTMYGYIDVDGDVLKLADGLRNGLGQMAASQPAMAPYVNQDYAAIFTALGLADIKAAGFSSVPDGTGFFRNRVFLYTPEKRQGLLAGFGGKSGPFAYVYLAPADTDIYCESEIDVPVVYQTIRDVVGRVGGETSKNLVEDGLKKAGESLALSVLDLINGLKGRAVLVMRFDNDKTLRLPGIALPAFSLMIRIDGVGPTVEAALATQMKNLVRMQRSDNVRMYFSSKPSPLDGINPVFAIDGSTLYLATTREFLDECRTSKAGLAKNPAFQQSLAQVGSEGNGLTYLSPRLFQRLREFEKLNPDLPPQVQSSVHWVMASLPKPDRPLITVRTNLPDGILIRSYWDRSLKQDVAMTAVYNPITIGVLAAMAIPAFQKVQTSSQEKAVMNNLRMLGAAADQYYLETGKTSALYSDLVGPTRYVKVVTPVAGENYRLVRFQQGRPLQVRLPTNGQLIEYKP